MMANVTVCIDDEHDREAFDDGDRLGQQVRCGSISFSSGAVLRGPGAAVNPVKSLAPRVPQRSEVKLMTQAYC